MDFIPIDILHRLLLSVSRRDRFHNVKRFIGYIAIMIFFLLLIDGLLPQAQIFLFSGIVLIKSVALKAILALCLAVCLLVHLFKTGKITRISKIIIPYSLFLLYLAIHLLLFKNSYPLDYLLFSYNAYYFFLVMFPFAAFLSLNMRLFNKLLLYMSIPLLAIGLLQFFLNEPLLPLSSADDYFQVGSWEYYEGKIRSFSLFSSGLNYGQFLSLIGAFAACNISRRRAVGRIAALMMLLAVSFAVYTTLTRNIYIQYLFTVLTAFLLARETTPGIQRRVRASGFITVLPFLYAALSVILVFAVQFYVLVYLRNPVLMSEETLNTRLMAWIYYFPFWIQNGPFQFLFGAGLFQGRDEFIILDKVVIDNNILSVGLHIGLIGLALWAFLMWRIWKWMLGVAMRQSNDMMVLAIVSLWATWLSSGLFNVTLSLYPMLAMVLLALSRCWKRLPQDNMREKILLQPAVEA